MGLRRLVMGAAGPGIVAAGLVIGAGLASAQESPDSIIAARQAGMEHVSDIMGATKKAMDAGQDVAPLAAQLKEVGDWGRKIPSMFPVGTETGHKTKARSEIWSDRAGFEKTAANSATEGDKLAQLAASGDKAAFAAQYQATGTVCGSCHRNYRSR